MFVLLNEINITLPAINQKFITNFLNFLSPKGQIKKDNIYLTPSEVNFLPKLSFLFSDSSNPYANFLFNNGSNLKVEISNITNVAKKSKYKYSHIEIEDFTKRMESFKLIGLDHIGFNLPYFNGVHPTILSLRDKLKDSCLYHTFPKHLEDAPWDFIIPGTKEEIERNISINYQTIRKPKFEIVSFENSSTPLIQIDIQSEGKFEDFIKVFPEAIPDPNLRNLWIYIKNHFGIDICFVLNEVTEEDWSYQFAKERI